MLYLFKSYGDFAEWVDVAYWWSFIGKDLRLQPAQQACFNDELVSFYKMAPRPWLAFQAKAMVKA